MSDRRRFGGMNTSPVAYGAGDRAGSVILFPSGSIRRPPLKSAQIRATAIDICLVVSAFTFVTVTGLGITAGIFYLLFCKS